MAQVVGAGNQSGILQIIAGTTNPVVNNFGQPVSVFCVNNATAGTVTITAPNGSTASYIPVASQLHCIRLGVGASVTFSQAPGAMAIVSD